MDSLLQEYLQFFAEPLPWDLLTSRKDQQTCRVRAICNRRFLALLQSEIGARGPHHDEDQLDHPTIPSLSLITSTINLRSRGLLLTSLEHSS